MPGTVRLHRVFHAPPERVYKAFLDADGMAFRMSFTTLGWQDSLMNLRNLVEPEIPG